MLEIINSNYHDSDKYSEIYKKAKPFPHIVFDNFFNQDLLESVLKEFPDLKNIDKSIQFHNIYEKKLATNSELFFKENTKKLIYFLNSSLFLSWLQKLTGIQETLISDPYFFGGGFHEIKRDGFLKLHADFNKHKTTNLDRRLNILIYLNHNWKKEYGGGIEFWSKDLKNCVVREIPIFNKVVIFSTTSDSFHGHPDPLKCPENMSRKSIALYYYSNGRPKNEINEDHNTLFVERPKNDNLKLINYLRLLVPPIIPYLIKKINK